MIGNLIDLGQFNLNKKRYLYFLHLEEQKSKEQHSNTTYLPASHLDLIRTQRANDIFNFKNLNGGVK